MGRQAKANRLGIITLGLAVALLVTGLFPTSAWADEAAPTNLQFESVKVFHNVIEEDDFVLIFHYNIHYDASQPDEPANKVFTFRLLDTDGATYLGAIVPYAYFNSGYDQGCGAFYFTVDDAPDWEGAYVVKITGNPEYFSSPPVASRTLVTSDYSQLESQEENQTLLGNYVLDIAKDLEINWSTTLTYISDLGELLNTAGESYFRGAITGLQSMAPQIFLIQTSSPTYEETPWTSAKGEEYKARFEETSIGHFVQDIGDFFHVPWNVITGMAIVAGMFAVAIFCQWRYGNIKPTPVAGNCFMLGGTVLGWWSPAIMAIISLFIGGLFLGYVWIFRHG
jgi:hypothetical protein